MKEEQRGRGLVTEHAASVAPTVTAAAGRRVARLDGHRSAGAGGLLPTQQQRQQRGGKDKGGAGRLRGEGNQRELPEWKKTPVVGTTGRTSPGRVGMGMQK